MLDYVATFHTHYAALRSSQRLTAKGIENQLAPVPRVLSASCGTCVRYRADSSHPELMHEDYEGIYRSEGGNYTLLQHNE